MATFYAAIGDANIDLETVLSDEDGPVDLTGNPQILFTAFFRDDHTIVPISGNGVTGDQVASPGSAIYTLKAGDLLAATAKAGTYLARWKVTKGGAVASFPDPGYDSLVLS